MTVALVVTAALILSACTDASSSSSASRPAARNGRYESEVVKAGYDDYAWASLRLVNTGKVPVLPLITDCRAMFFGWWESPIAWVRLPKVIQVGESDIVRIRSHVPPGRWRQIRKSYGGQPVDAVADCARPRPRS